MLKWTGERMLADKNLGFGTAEHLHRYAYALNFVKDKVVLDIASGEGYGSNLLSTTAKSVFGIDISSEAIEHARECYKKDNITFLQGDVTNIPLTSNCVDTIVCFETIEHVDKQSDMLSEFVRVLRPDGIVIISSPAKENYGEHHNEFHVKELTSSEFAQVVEPFFKYRYFFKQTYLESSLIFPSFQSDFQLKQFVGDFSDIQLVDFENAHIYNIGVFSNRSFIFPDINMTFFDAREMNKAYWLFQKKKIEQRVEMTYKKSYSYRIGTAIVKPFSFIRKFFKPI